MLTLLALSAFAADPEPAAAAVPAPQAVAPESAEVDAPALAEEGDGNGAVPEAGGGRGRGNHGGRQGHGGPPEEAKFRLGGVFQTNFVAEHLERNGDPAYAANPPRPTFTVAHFRPNAELDATPWLDVRAGVEFAAIPDSPPVDPEMLGDALAVSGTDETILDPSLDELFVRLHVGRNVRQNVKMGVMHTSFGLRDDYDRYDHFFLGGQLAYMEPERRFGVSPGIDIGVGYRLAWKDLGALDLQLINGSGVSKLDSTAAKDVVARLSVTPLRVFDLRGSIMHAGDATDGHTHGAVSLEVNTERFAPAFNPRVVGEALLSRVVEGGAVTDRFGWFVAAATDVPLHTSVTDHLSVIGSYSSFDPDFIVGGPDTEASFDQQWFLDAGANVYWNTEGKKQGARHEVREGEGVVAFTGITYEMLTPQNAELPVSHSVTVQCGISK